MRIHKLKLVLITASILALGAGVFAGMAVSRLPTSTTPALAVPPDHASIADELQLTDSQRDQMRSIWQGVRSDVHQTVDRAQSIDKERDAAVVALLTDSQKARYAVLNQQAAEQLAALNTQRDQAFHEGVDQTRKILTEAQRLTYDRIIRDRVGTKPEGSIAAIGGSSSLATPTTEPMTH